MAKVICLMGPTASGKTALAIALAKQLPVDIISVDSTMVYRGLDIGSAKPSADELLQAPHQLIDICSPLEPYSVADFVRDAKAAINRSVQAGRYALLVGGTMLYFKALQQGLSELPAADPKLREAILSQAKVDGWQALHQTLAQVDPVAAKKINANDQQRIQRALEVYRLTGKPLSEHWALQEKDKPKEQFINIALFPKQRKRLHELIASRFIDMAKQGLLDEAQSLLDRQADKALPALRSVGYRQAIDYLEGNIDKATFIEKGIIATRQLAKRQLTWLRSWDELECFDPFAEDELLTNVMMFLKAKGI